MRILDHACSQQPARGSRLAGTFDQPAWLLRTIAARNHRPPSIRRSGDQQAIAGGRLRAVLLLAVAARCAQQQLRSAPAAIARPR
jgi:hypothetical protein